MKNSNLISTTFTPIQKSTYGPEIIIPVPGHPLLPRLLAQRPVRTMRVLDALRPEDLEWVPAPGAFSSGDLFRHLPGLERFMWAETVAPLFGLTAEQLAAKSVQES